MKLSLTMSRHSGTKRLPYAQAADFYVVVVVSWTMVGNFGLVASDTLKRCRRFETKI